MVTDFHSHILPGIDDGSQSIEESVEMLRITAAQGIRRVVATPHFYPQQDDLNRFLKKRDAAERMLREKIENDDGVPEISIGAEVYYFPGISESGALSRLTIGKKRYILLEMPQSPWSSQMYREVENIYVKQGITPIIAHVDRYIDVFRTHGIPERLAELPILVQANASFFLNRWTTCMAMRMLKRGQIHLLGSDCHNLRSRPPRLGPAVEVIRRQLGENVLENIMQCEDLILCDI